MNNQSYEVVIYQLNINNSYWIKAGRGEWGGHWYVRYCSTGLFFFRYFGNFYLELRYAIFKAFSALLLVFSKSFTVFGAFPVSNCFGYRFKWATLSCYFLVIYFRRNRVMVSAWHRASTRDWSFAVFGDFLLRYCGISRIFLWYCGVQNLPPSLPFG